MMRMRGWALLTALVAVPAAGCGDDASREAARGRAKAAKDKRKAEQVAADKAKAAAAEDAAKNIYQFSEKPTFASIPDKPVVGRLRNAAFDIQQVVLEPVGDAWQIQFHDAKLAHPTALARDSHPLVVTLDGELPQPGKRYERELAEGGAEWLLPPMDAAPAQPAAGRKLKKGEAAPPSAAASAAAGPTTWRPDIGYVVEITRWEAKPYDEGGPAFQDAGLADGRVALVMRGGGLPEAWVAGTFQDATVRYMGKPRVPTAPADAPAEAQQKGGKGSK
ncbi:MAG: hypothetical protein H6702_17530 [Myxococcales bacterium]|nr:hypothetical protein [Myxococcales bacterium]